MSLINKLILRMIYKLLSLYLIPIKYIIITNNAMDYDLFYIN